ncbi:MAG: TerB family tellurite resistance protein [Hyphomicrobiaceae bacterium]|nr:TerB family tellurite resistance protein [Hyphomicrobiaceae bacterium]
MFDSQMFPLIVAGFIVAAILIPCIALFIVYRRYKKLAKSLPSPFTIQQTGEKTLVERQQALMSNLLEGWAKLPAEEVDVSRHALWTGMLLEAASDGSIDHREMKFVSDLFGRMSGEKMNFRPVIHAAELVERDKKAALAEIAKARDVSNPSKEHILAGAFLVTICDHSLTEAETACLGDIAGALGLSQRERKAMFTNITERFGL